MEHCSHPSQPPPLPCPTPSPPPPLPSPPPPPPLPSHHLNRNSNPVCRICYLATLSGARQTKERAAQMPLRCAYFATRLLGRNSVDIRRNHNVGRGYEKVNDKVGETLRSHPPPFPLAFHHWHSPLPPSPREELDERHPLRP